MFDSILSFLKDLPGGSRQTTLRPEDDPRVAAAALLFHVLDADGIREASEVEKLKETLSQTYNVTGAELENLLEAGEKAEQEAIDLYAFTSVLKRHLDADARKSFIGLMWGIVFADGEMHELEDNLVWRVAELIGVDNRDRVVLRQEMQEKYSKS
ncbi:TerB family tellurite resistance protein [Nitratireductor aquimarinus]|uniref:TerB family tellurite resistance protein n=1 Tax=Nitratireductor aquimarinus TaxID=889300 RepID=A0ABU4AQN7_9HYPH|nr:MULTISPECIES: TerB family tellurite resistance protein [Alphaproteobacteria]MBY6022667.1 TerB family tellurite resistance protein [Nitratireductor sp. DP7N14-4]MBN7757875.1 TerB family tellurite resistance protein [Nitratireductor aquimarinus]MBN7762340.1 TerB family tellurite resistance protein [Nitratireductor aquibiodomus]MBN7777937.1 TerB family tellurite resistance protein [Nitratireductor pacificus]MBN7782259.1 TerB family tellurite resistance protein [Nitratireductor pacificus]